MLKLVATGTFLGLIAFLLTVRRLRGRYPWSAATDSRLHAARRVRAADGLARGGLLRTEPARPATTGRYAVLLATAISALWLMVVARPSCSWRSAGRSAAWPSQVSWPTATPRQRGSRRVAGRLLVGDVALWTAVALLLSAGVSGRAGLEGVGWVVPALLAVAGVVRSALLPAWRWLPLTAESPSPVSALLHAGVVNGMGLLAILLWPVFAAARGLLVLVAVGGVTAVARHRGHAGAPRRPGEAGQLDLGADGL